MNEFDLINTYFKPLASGFPGSFGLNDDAALIQIPDGMELVITKDAICEGIHFIGDEDASMIAKKTLRVNLSDLAAKGAKPFAYFLAMILPKDTPQEWIRRFAQGLKEDQALFNIHLAGGDTTAALGKKAFSITALGLVSKGKMLRRNGAKKDDIIVVSGTLGDSTLGLMSLQEKRNNPYLIQRYQLPEPRMELGLSLHGIASACMDISDGLVQDLGHICKASGVGAVIEIDKIPLSPAAELFPEAQMLALTGGDDYELLFTVPPEKIHLIPKDCTVIGKIKEGSGVVVLGGNGEPVTLTHKGYQHFYGIM